MGIFLAADLDVTWIAAIVAVVGAAMLVGLELTQPKTTANDVMELTESPHDVPSSPAAVSELEGQIIGTFRDRELFEAFEHMSESERARIDRERAEPVSGTEFEIYRDDAGEYRWRLLDDNNKVIAASAEGYTRKDSVERAIQNVAAGATVNDLT